MRPPETAAASFHSSPKIPPGACPRPALTVVPPATNPCATTPAAICGLRMDFTEATHFCAPLRTTARQQEHAPRGASRYVARKRVVQLRMKGGEFDGAWKNRGADWPGASCNARGGTRPSPGGIRGCTLPRGRTHRHRRSTCPQRVSCGPAAHLAHRDVAGRGRRAYPAGPARTRGSHPERPVPDADAGHRLISGAPPRFSGLRVGALVHATATRDSRAESSPKHDSQSRATLDHAPRVSATDGGDASHPQNTSALCQRLFNTVQVRGCKTADPPLAGTAIGAGATPWSLADDHHDEFGGCSNVVMWREPQRIHTRGSASGLPRHECLGV